MSKRGRTNKIDKKMASIVTQEDRKFLKESFESGKSKIYDFRLKRVKSSKELTQQPHLAMTMIRRSPKDLIGAGSYGSAHRIKDEKEVTMFVAKVSVVGSPLIGSIKSPYRSENVENRMAQLLWKYIVEKKRSPHICMPLGEHRVVQSVLPKKIDKQAKHSVVSYMEHAHHEDVRSFLEKNEKQNLDMLSRVILFQVTYTLVAIYRVFPLFRHNDLKDDNVLLQIGPNTGFVHYKVSIDNIWKMNVDFFVPYVGVRALLGDFDFSCIAGLIDNGKVLEENFNTPTIHVNARKDHGADIFTFICTLLGSIGHKLSDDFKQELNKLYPLGQLQSFKNNENYSHATPSMSHTLPSAQRILMSDFFLRFRKKKSENVIENWHLTCENDMIVFPSWNPNALVEAAAPLRKNVKTHPIKEMVRKIPLIYPRNGQRYLKKVPVNPSMAYFSTWKTKPKDLDNRFQNPQSFKLSYWNRIKPAFEMVYLEKKDNRKKRTQVGFFMPKEKMKSFLERVLEIGSTFINNHWVSPDLWPLVFTMAFVDTVWEHDEYISIDQTCWYMDSWCEHWKSDIKFTKRQMLQFALQWSWYRCQ